MEVEELRRSNRPALPAGLGAAAGAACTGGAAAAPGASWKSSKSSTYQLQCRMRSSQQLTVHRDLCWHGGARLRERLIVVITKVEQVDLFRLWSRLGRWLCLLWRRSRFRPRCSGARRGGSTRGLVFEIVGTLILVIRLASVRATSTTSVIRSAGTTVIFESVSTPQRSARENI